MQRKRSLTAALAALACVTAASVAQAGDTFRLGGGTTITPVLRTVDLPDAAPTQNLKLEADREADLLDVSRRYYGGFYGGARYGYGYGGYRGYGYGGYRSYGYGGYRGFGYGGYRGYGYSYYPRAGFGLSFGYSRPYYYAPPAYYPYYSGSYYCPIGISIGASVQAIPAESTQFYQLAPLPTETLPQPRLSPNDGIYRYDGGPANPVPLPSDDSIPSSTRPSIPLEGRPVSLPAAKPKLQYPAYGEEREPRQERMPAPKGTSVVRGTDR